MYLNKIICGDCIELMKAMPLVDMTLTDIPYNVVNRKSNGLRNLDKKDADILTFDLQVFLDEVVRVTKGSIYIFCSTEQVSFIRSHLIMHGLTTRLCIWEKTNPAPLNGDKVWLSGIECCVYGKKKGAVFNEHCKNTVWRYPTVKSKVHHTQKPLELFRYLVRVSSNEGDTVFDPCAGSGTSVLAALLEKRNYIAFELNEEYYKAALARLQGINSNKA